MKLPNRSLTTLTLAALLGPFAATGALANEEKTMPSALNFKAYDADGNGQVSQEEFRAQGGRDEVFSEADSNGDNQLSADEFAKADVAGAGL